MQHNDTHTDLVVPELGESITEAVIGRWYKQVGDAVIADEPVVELETDKVTVELPAPASGTLTEQHAAEGSTVAVGAVVGSMAVGPGAAAAVSTPASAPAQTQAPTPAATTPAPVLAATERDAATASPVAADLPTGLTPAQRRQARMGIASAPAPAPVSAPAPTPATAPATAAVSRPAAAPNPAPATPSADARERVVPMSSLRKRIAERLVQAQHDSASLTTFNEVDMHAVMELRKRHKEAFAAAHGIKLGFLSFFAKACVSACKRFPGLNAEIRGDNIVYKHHYDFGIAVSTERGLVVPVVRDVDQRGFADIEGGIADLATKARDGKLAISDLTGGTFTITNGGIFGSMLSTPLLNYPQTGILGMHNIVRRPVVVADGSIQVRPIMYIALTYDHRVVDGREAVQFLVAVKERIEQPESLMFDL